MYEVWFVDCDGNRSLEATFKHLEEAEAYVDNLNSYLAHGEKMYIEEKMEEKNWIGKIKKGMELIKQGCLENHEWGACEKCPFTDYCDTIFDEYYMFPDYFFEDDEEA